MSPEAWEEFWRVTLELLWDMVRLVGLGVWLGWCLRGRRDLKREREQARESA